jgi:lipid-binding SYLF domain-containing protein
MLLVPVGARAELTTDLERRASAALSALYASSPAASRLAEKAKGVLVFPDVRESSLDVGALAGDGVLFVDGSVAGYYSLGDMQAALEAGAQSYGYAIFFMSDAALARMGDWDGFDPGLDPDVVVVEIGATHKLPALMI